MEPHNGTTFFPFESNVLPNKFVSKSFYRVFLLFLNKEHCSFAATNRQCQFGTTFLPATKVIQHVVQNVSLKLFYCTFITSTLHPRSFTECS